MHHKLENSSINTKSQNLKEQGKNPIQKISFKDKPSWEKELQMQMLGRQKTLKKTLSIKAWSSNKKGLKNKLSQKRFFSSSNKNFLTLSPGSSVMLVPMPLVMRGVPAQIFFAVPENKTYKWKPTLRRKLRMWKCLTYARPSSAGQTWAWSPCRRGRCGRCGVGLWGGTTLPAAQKASSELSL